MDILQMVLAVVGGLVTVLAGVIAVLRAIPGDQGEEKLQGIADFLSSVILGRK